MTAVKVEPDPATAASTIARRFRVTEGDKDAPSALYALMVQPVHTSVVRPKHYFSASNELTTLALIVTWTITLIHDWRLVWDHPARKYTGHLNPCYGWDFPPASYFAVCFAAVDVFFAFRYATLEAVRTKLLDIDGRYSWRERFALATAYSHAAASVVWLLLWSVGPPDNRWTTHLAIFAVCIVLRYLCTLGNYVEQRFGSERQRRRVKRVHTVHVLVYGVVTVTLPVLYFTDFLVYQAQQRVGVDPPIPWQVLQVMDLVWVACVAVSSYARVPEPPIQVTRKILEFDEEYELAENEDSEMLVAGLKDRKGGVMRGIRLQYSAEPHDPRVEC